MGNGAEDDWKYLPIYSNIPIMWLKTKASTILALCIALFLEGCGQNEGNFKIDKNGTITAYKGTDKNIVIPDQINGVSVIAIGESLFLKYGNLVSVTIPSSVMSIDNHAFENNRLTSVNIHHGLISIGVDAFFDNKINSVIIPDSVISIDAGAFRRNQLTSVTIGNGVTSIGWRAFTENKLSSVIIPNNITSIGADAFRENFLDNVTINDGVTNIGANAFSDNLLTTVTIPASVKDIGSGAFSRNQLTSVTIPTGVRSIGDYAFANNQITSVTILANLDNIPNKTFSNNQLKTFNIGDGVSLNFNVLSSNDGLTTVVLGEDVVFDTYVFGSSVCYEYLYNGRKSGTYSISYFTDIKTTMGFEFVETKYGAVITGYYGKNDDDDDIIIPWQLYGMPVIGIDAEFDQWNFNHKQLPNTIIFINGKTVSDWISELPELQDEDENFIQDEVILN